MLISIKNKSFKLDMKINVKHVGVMATVVIIILIEKLLQHLRLVTNKYPEKLWDKYRPLDGV